MSDSVAAPLECRDLEKSYLHGDGSELRVLQGVDLSIDAGEAVAIIGASGAGKSTLLHLLGVLDRPTAGEILVEGKPVMGLDPAELPKIRNSHIGFVFQFHHLLREFSALENVMIPCLVGEMEESAARARAESLLEAVGLAERLDHRPRQLSGGEQQRVAVARALSNEPSVLLADEPTGNLDGPTSEELHDLLFRLREERNLSMVLVTHNVELASRTDRVLRLAGGLLQDA